MLYQIIGLMYLVFNNIFNMDFFKLYPEGKIKCLNGFSYSLVSELHYNMYREHAFLGIKSLGHPVFESRLTRT